MKENILGQISFKTLENGESIYLRGLINKHFEECSAQYDNKRLFLPSEDEVIFTKHIIPAKVFIDKLTNEYPVFEGDLELRDIAKMIYHLECNLGMIDEIKRDYPLNFDLDALKSKTIVDWVNIFREQYYTNDNLIDKERLGLKNIIIDYTERSNQRIYESMDNLDQREDLPELFKSAYKNALNSEILKNHTKITYLFNPLEYTTEIYNENHATFLNSHLRGQEVFYSICELFPFASEKSFARSLVDYVQLKYFSLNKDNINEINTYINYLDDFLDKDDEFSNIKERFNSIPEDFLIKNQPN